jgi:site-specific DNA recombinase
MQRAIGYSRVSTEKQDLVRQEKLISEYCDSHDYILVDIIEEKVSGAKNEVDREGLMKLLSLQGNEADTIIVAELSRLSREDDTLDVLNKVNSLLQKGFNVVFLDNEDKVYTAYSKLSLYDIIRLSVEADYSAGERKKITMRMKTGKYPKIQANPYMYAGGTAPYGFDIIDNPEFAGQKNNRPAKSIMVVNDVEMENVRLIYSWILDGMTVRDAAKKANEMGFITRENKPFCQTSIAKIIKNPIYNGRRRFKGFNLETEKIISDADWNLAQERLQKNRLYKGHGNKHFNPLKGIIFCPCGYGMMLHQMNSIRDGAYLTLHCCVRNRPEYGHKCKNSGIKAGVVFDAVWKCVKSVILEKEYKNKSNEQVKSYERIIATLKKQILDTNNTIKNLIADRDKIPDILLRLSNMNGVSEHLINTYNNKYTEFDKRIIENEKKKELLNQEISVYQQKIRDIKRVAILQELDNLDDIAKADIYKRVLSRVVYYSENQFSGFIVISFKNGIETIVITTGAKKRIVAQLPSTFKFDKEKKKIVVEIIEKPHNVTNYDLQPSQYKEYSIKELKDAFSVEEWRI